MTGTGKYSGDMVERLAAQAHFGLPQIIIRKSFPPPCRGRAGEGVEMRSFNVSTPIRVPLASLSPHCKGEGTFGFNELLGFNIVTWCVKTMTRSIAVSLVVLMLVVLFVGGAQPQAVGLVPAPWDKLAHAVFFFVFALLLARFVSLAIAWVIVFALLVGAADEIHQLFLPGREAGWDDWLADAIGVCLVLVVYKRPVENDRGRD